MNGVFPSVLKTAKVVPVFKDCVRYIFASLLFASKREHL